MDGGKAVRFGIVLWNPEMDLNTAGDKWWIKVGLRVSRAVLLYGIWGGTPSWKLCLGLRRARTLFLGRVNHALQLKTVPNLHPDFYLRDRTYLCWLRQILLDLWQNQAGEDLTFTNILWASAWFEDFSHAPYCSSGTFHAVKSQSVSLVLCLTIHIPHYTS